MCPFPALLYCFSTIDLLGSLYEGDATGNTRRYGQQVGTTIKARKYMVDLIGYPEFETNLPQDQFRHKLVHLAQPQTLVYDNNRSIGWQLDNLYLGDHMILKKLESRQEILTLTPITLEGDHVFIKKMGSAVLLIPARKPWDIIKEALSGLDDDFLADRVQGEQQRRNDPWD